MKKSKLIQEIGLEVLDVLQKELNTIKGKLHPMNLQFKAEYDVTFLEGSFAQSQEDCSLVYSLLNTKYNQALKEEYDAKENIK